MRLPLSSRAGVPFAGFAAVLRILACRDNRPPVRFRYTWLADGTLALTDAEGHVWGYVREGDR